MANQFSKKLKEFTKDKEEVESAIKCWTEMIQSSHDKRYCAMLQRSIDKVIKQFKDKWKDTPEDVLPLLVTKCARRIRKPND